MRAAGAAAVVFLLVRMSLADLRSRRIPARYDLLLLLAGLTARLQDPGELAEGLLAGVIFLAAGFLLYCAAGGRGLGGGDLKWIAASAVWLGVWDTLRALFVAGITALFVQAVRRRPEEKEKTFAFGPYLALGTGLLLALRYF